MYRKDSLENLKNDLNVFDNKLAIKIVRGAYLNQDKKYNILFDTIEDTHTSYNKAVEIISKLKNPTIIATHNETSCRLALDINRNPNVGFAQLLGMNDKLTDFLLREEQKVFKYIPYGPLRYSIPYLIRRLYENYDILKYVNL